MDRPTLFWSFMAAIIIAGILSFMRMPKLEDPAVATKQAMVVVPYPGATAHEVELEVAQTLEEVKMMSEAVTSPTHNHPEGLKGAEATAVAGFLAKRGLSKTEIEKYINQYYYPMNFTLEQIRPTYRYEGSCQQTVPFALKAFFESESFEDAIRHAISIGGDSDTIAAITGGVAGIYYKIDTWIEEKALQYLDDFQKDVLKQFESAFSV